jgi:hypothetical protein
MVGARRVSSGRAFARTLSFAHLRNNSDHPLVGVGTSTGFNAGINRARSRFAGIAR